MIGLQQAHLLHFRTSFSLPLTSHRKCVRRCNTVSDPCELPRCMFHNMNENKNKNDVWLFLIMACDMITCWIYVSHYWFSFIYWQRAKSNASVQVSRWCAIDFCISEHHFEQEVGSCTLSHHIGVNKCRILISLLYSIINRNGIKRSIVFCSWRFFVSTSRYIISNVKSSFSSS